MTKRDARALHQSVRDLRTASPQNPSFRDGALAPDPESRDSGFDAFASPRNDGGCICASPSPARRRSPLPLPSASDFQKSFLTPDPNHLYIPRHPVPLRGAFRERHGRGAGCGGRGGALDGRCQRGRRRRVVLTPRRWCQVGGGNSAGDGGKKADHRGEHGISRKPLRGECRMIPVTRCEYSCAYLLP